MQAFLLDIRLPMWEPYRKVINRDTVVVSPFANPGDRKWIQVWVDLSAYAGEDVELIFNTRPGPDDNASDTRNDLPVWGDPEIIVR